MPILETEAGESTAQALPGVHFLFQKQISEKRVDAVNECLKTFFLNLTLNKQELFSTTP
jgi:hypothetical protein